MISFKPAPISWTRLRTFIALVLSVTLFSFGTLDAKKKKRRSKRTSRSSVVSPLKKGLVAAKKGDYINASKAFYKVSMSPRYKKKSTQTRYMLGLMLYKMKFYQLAAFQFLRVIRDGNSKYLQNSLEKLSISADYLGDDTLLRYAIAKTKISSFPKAHRDMLYYRLGEVQLKSGQYSSAAASLSKVGQDSLSFGKAKYLQGLAYAKQNRLGKAIDAFDQLLISRKGKKITDNLRVNSILGLARVYYQGEKWEDAIDMYRKIPRDTRQWHESLFEVSWAMLRSGKFRSALSNFQTLHSSYYNNFYQPESLLLRSIVYLYICKYDEMEKVLQIFSKTYKPAYKMLKSYRAGRVSEAKLFETVNVYLKDYNKYGEDLPKKDYKLPLQILNYLAKDGNFTRANNYIGKINQEMRRLKKMPSSWQGSSIGRYAKKVLTTRIKKAQNSAGKKLKTSILKMSKELVSLIEQEDFIRYEMTNGKKEMLKKKVAGKYVSKRLDEEKDRSYFIKNGYQYWPFEGEYWLDELGNYHYVGTQSCKL